MRACRVFFPFLTGVAILPGAAHGQTATRGTEKLHNDTPVVTLATGIISGRVLFADTNGPGRFVKVYLKSTRPTALADNPFASLAEQEDDAGEAGKSKPKLTAADEAEQKKRRAASLSVMALFADLMISTTTAADGSYSFTNVKPGTYYVHVTAPGYIDPLAQFSAAELNSTDAGVRAKIAAAVSMVTVAGQDPVRADLRLERGADISGRVLYDDGSPAVGWVVRPVHPQGPPASIDALSAMGFDSGDLDLTHRAEASQTDDTGQFRVSGLPTGDYVLEARFSGGTPGRSSLNPIVSGAAGGGGSVMAGVAGIKLTVYSGNVTREADARAIPVKAGEDRSGADLAVPLSNFRAVGGAVLGKRDGHPVNGGSVVLSALSADGNPDPALRWVTAVQPDGSFRFDYIPGPGQFLVEVTHAVDATAGPTRQVFGSLVTESKPTRSYGPVKQTITLAESDLTDLKLQVPDSDPAK